MTGQRAFLDKWQADFHSYLPLAWLPNEVGFRFVGVRHDGSTLECTVIKDENGMHRIKEIAIAELIGWHAR